MYLFFVKSAVLKELPILYLVATNKKVPSLSADLILTCNINVYLISLGILKAF